VTLLKVQNKQHTYKHYWFWVTTVFLDDLNGTFSVFAWFYVMKNVLNF